MFSILKRFKVKVYGFIANRTPVVEVFTVLYSLLLHIRFSFNNKDPGFEKARLEYFLLKNYHIVEKGLALPDPRKGFGQPKIINLIKKTREYEKLYPDLTIGVLVRDTLREYLEFHKNDMFIFSADFLDHMKLFLREKSAQGEGGLKYLKKSEMVTLGGDHFERFLNCRHSIRNYSKDPVDDGIIAHAISVSQNTPSVCNRQGWFVHYYSDKKKIKELLTYQNGNAGFTESIDKLLIVTASTKAFTRYEHNQLFIDGGLYSMNLMLALHSVGLGSCPLNTCMSWLKENELKKSAAIESHERLIMMIAVGNLLEEFSVARSKKNSVSKIMRQH